MFVRFMHHIVHHQGLVTLLLAGEVKARAEAIGRAMAAEQPVTAVTDLIESGRVPGAVQSTRT